MPYNLRAVEIMLPEAERLADLYGVAQDLDIAERICKTAIQLDGTHGFDTDIMDAIVSSAMVRYCRCFKTGVRTPLADSEMAHLSSNDIAHHKLVEALRDKFIAHSVNPFEETYVTASAATEDGVPLPIQSVQPGSHRVILSSFDAVPLVGLISKVRFIVEGLIRDEEKKVLLLIRSMPLETIHAGNLHYPRELQRDDAFQSRIRAARSRTRRRTKS